MFVIIFILGLGLGFGVRGLQFSTSTKNVPIDNETDIIQAFVNPPAGIESSGVRDLEVQKTKSFVERFETLQKSGKHTVLDLFTPPADSKETQVLGFLLGKDIRMIRMYATAGLDYQLDWYYVESISKNDNRITVKLKELRTRYGNSNGEYNAARNDLVMEIIEKEGKLLIDKYHHKRPLVEGNLKYEGFY